MELHTNELELRGIKNVTSAKGNVYYNIYCEEADGEQMSFYCKNISAIPQKLKKGDKIVVDVTYNKFKELEVISIRKVD